MFLVIAGGPFDAITDLSTLTGAVPLEWRAHSAPAIDVMRPNADRVMRNVFMPFSFTLVATGSLVWLSRSYASLSCVSIARPIVSQ